MRKLSREYGYSALGVYLALSAIDFPFCFLAVRWLGTERIGHLEHVFLSWIRRVVPYPFPSQQKLEVERAGGLPEGYGTAAPECAAVEEAADYGHDFREAEQLNQSENASEYCSHTSWPLVEVVG